jgi:hypothetical protein
VAVIPGEAPGDLHLGGDRAHHVVAGEERDLVDRVVVAGVGHRHREVAIAIEGDGNGPQLDGHVGGERLDHRRRQRRQGVGADLGHHQAGTIKIGQALVGDGVGGDEVLTDHTAAGAGQGTRGFEGLLG